ncbi:MAG: bacillithiol biosynthesis BshC [Candidatus Krumholzibacteriota bacterium]
MFRDWLGIGLEADFLAPEQGDASGELSAALAGSATTAGSETGPSPLFGSAWVGRWSDSLAEDLPHENDRAAFRAQVADLQAGVADVVVTGQQPGYLGGPLYTLFKVATVIALARRRSAAGKPTVPVFWSGDADDDLAEALAPVAWFPGESGLQRGPTASQGPAGRSRSPVLGRLANDAWNSQAASLLDRVNTLHEGESGRLAGDLAEIWRLAETRGWGWARLSRRAILRVFAGTGLVVVSGDDPGLHAVAGPLYREILDKQDILARQAEQRGNQLTAHGWHAQINARSLARPLFKMVEDHRVPLEAGDQDTDPSLLRPGVMLRSPIQDWLLRPAAVVVGPGEMAYLRQLDPLYRELNLPRSPLVPRLFAWLLPEGFEPAVLADFRNHPAAEANLVSNLAAEAEDKVRLVLEDILAGRLGLEKGRARSLAAGRARRWSKGVGAMLRGEIKQSRLDAVSGLPPWIFPDGARQERSLAYQCAAALWGESLVTACLEAASMHLEEGARDNWREFSIQVPDPGQ